MRNRTYGGVRGRKTKVGRKLLRFPPTRFLFLDVEILNSNETLSVKKYHRRREALQRRAQRNEAQACGIVFRGARLPPPTKGGREGDFKERMVRFV